MFFLTQLKNGVKNIFEKKIIKYIDKLSLQLYLLFTRFAAKRINEEEHGILIFANLLIGDLAMSGYLIQSIRHHYPTRKITLVCKENIMSVFNLDLIIPVTSISWKLYVPLQKEKYGLVFNIFSDKLLSLCDGLAIGNIYGTHLVKFEKPMNMVDMILSIKPPNVPTRSLPLILPPIIPPNKKKYIVVHIGAQVLTRLWPIDLLNDIIKCIDIKIIFTGLEQSQSYMKELNLKIKMEKIDNMIGKTTYLELLSIINSSVGIISMDTSVIHWARLMKIPSLSVLGPVDSNIFGANSEQFENAYHMSIDSLKCRDVHRHMSKHMTWVNHCNRRTCIFTERKCTKFSETEIESTIKDFMKNLKIKTKIEYSV
jgi:ADP-heptose:LPS heptosyltransferase